MSGRPTLGYCRSCMAAVVWVPRGASGKPHPCDPRVLVVITDDGRVARGRQSHFATCPDADAHRRARRNPTTQTKE